MAVEGISGGCDFINRRFLNYVHSLDTKDEEIQQTSVSSQNMHSGSSNTSNDDTNTSATIPSSSNEQLKEVARPSMSSNEKTFSKELKRRTEMEHPLVEKERQRLKLVKKNIGCSKMSARSKKGTIVNCK